MQKYLFLWACLSAALSVALGAFGAHGLKSVLSAEQLHTFEIGVRYQFYHSLGLLATALAADQLVASVWASRAAYCFLGGIVCFSGSLYLLASRQWIGIESWTWLGPITPLGGVLFIAGWLCLGYGAMAMAK